MAWTSYLPSNPERSAPGYVALEVGRRRAEIEKGILESERTRLVTLLSPTKGTGIHIMAIVGDGDGLELSLRSKSLVPFKKPDGLSPRRWAGEPPVRALRIPVEAVG